jgi:hypothetical protein
MTEPPVIDDAPLADPAEVRRAMEYYSARGWTDGLPVVPVTESYLSQFLATTARAPSDVIIPMPHLNRALTVRLAAINAALAGCLPAYFPVVLAAWDSEEGSPWAPLHTDNGLSATDSACTSTVIRSVLHIEARHTIVPEQLATDLADSIGRTGAMVRAFASVYVVLNPEHARLFDKHGWSKQDLKQAIIERGSRTYRDLAASGKEAIAKGTGWRLPADHPDALPQTAPSDPDTPVPILRSAHDVQIVVAGAPNAGVSSIVETFGAVGRPPSVVKVEDQKQDQEE